jgi:excinuclease ABC subunit C
MDHETGTGARVTETRPLDAQLELLPSGPGVYLLKDRDGKVIYVGKAANLRSRVRSYFRGGDERAQVSFLVQRVHDLETLVTANEKEALILENNLIKQYKPRYNIRLKDDKSYLSVKVTVAEEWPRVLLTRKLIKDGSRYFGPFTSALSVRETVDTIRKVIPLRTCSDGVFHNRARPCLEYQIKRCLAPCCLPVDREQYRAHLREAMLLLEGKKIELVRHLAEEMSDAAEDLRFEDAARLRDRLRAIEQTQQQQHAVAHGGIDQDVFGLYREGGFIEVQVLLVREGKLTGSQAYRLDDFEFPDDEVIAAVLTQFYQGDRYVPDEVVIPCEIEDAAERADYLRGRKGRRVEIVCPQRGDRVRLLELAQANAEKGFAERRDSERQYDRMSQELQRRLHLRNVPKRIECFDISNLHGGLAVGSMVSFDEGMPDTTRYRRFRVKTVVGADDFAMMYEVLRRRYGRAQREGDYPDLLVVDGGKGQLNVALEVLRELEIETVDAVGLAKMRVERAPRSAAVERSEERVFLPGRKNPVVLRRNSNALFLLQRVRDEAHRFAVTYHRVLRGKAELRSVLDTIPGVGAERRRSLLRYFGSLKRVRAASVEELAGVPGISVCLAQRIHASVTETKGGSGDPDRGTRLRLEDLAVSAPGAAEDASLRAATLPPEQDDGAGVKDDETR